MSKKKPKRPRYSKQQLAEAKRVGDKAIITELAGKMLSTDTDDLSYAETEFAASVLRATKPEGSICFIDLATIPGAQNFRFKTLYLSYHDDLEGQYGIEKFTGLVSIEEKREDVIRLNEYFEDWKKIIAKNIHKDQLLNTVINEVNKELKILKKLHAEGRLSDHDYKYKEMATVLHSKYIYLTTRSFFDEHGSSNVIAVHHGREIVINEYSLVHILNRHLAKAAKQYETGKSFHHDIELKWFELPYELKRLIEELGGHPCTSGCDLKNIPFRYNGTIYAIWTEEQELHRGGKITSYRRLETCYPLEQEDKLEELREHYSEVTINSKLSAFIRA